MVHDKRKDGPGSSAPNAKRKKGGNNGKWTTPHQDRVTNAHVATGKVEPGDVGMWVTCARGMESKAAHEVNHLFQKYARIMYGIKPATDALDDWVEAESENARSKNGSGSRGVDDGDEDDIEAQIKKELAVIKSTPRPTGQHFTPIRIDIECVLFTSMKHPIDPVAMARRICLDTKKESDEAAAAQEEAIKNGTEIDPVVRSCKYVNRLTPVSFTGKATKVGIEEAVRAVLPRWFKMVPRTALAYADQVGDKEGDKGGTEEVSGDIEESKSSNGEVAATAGSEKEEKEEECEEKPPYSFAVRPSMRRHDGLEYMDIINQVAAAIDQSHHKVSLENPDKVILIEIFRSTLGMSVVDGDWNEELRKYNISALYNRPPKGVVVTAGGKLVGAKGTSTATVPDAVNQIEE